MSNSSSSDEKKRNKSSSTQWTSLYQSLNVQKFQSFINNTIFDKKIVINPFQQDLKASDQFYNKIKAKKIKISKHHIEIDIQKAKRNFNNIFSDSTQSQMKNENEKQAEIQQLDEQLSKNYYLFSKKFDEDFNEKIYLQYLQWLNHMQNKNMISWFFSHGQSSLNLKSMSISNKTLSLLGYTPDQASLQIRQFNFNFLNFLGNQVYQTVFWVFLRNFNEYMETQIGINQAHQGGGNTYSVITSQIVGKNQRRIKVELKIYLASPYIVCMQILSIAKAQIIRDLSLQMTRKSIQMNQSIELKKCLDHILKFPKQSTYQNQAKRCSYILIGNYLE